MRRSQAPRVHPHASGDSTSRRFRSYFSVGSPPREWGQRLAVRNLAVNVGFTPTRVGTACCASSGCPISRVHPHASGDSGAWYGERYTHNGSPPREWGQRALSPMSGLCSGFTPTRVGTASMTVLCRSGLPVHPHASGDSDGEVCPAKRDAGSPPREWGQPTYRGVNQPVARFTPTRVGTAYTAHPSAII